MLLHGDINNLLSRNTLKKLTSFFVLYIKTNCLFENTLLLLSGGLKVKVEGNISDPGVDNPYFDPSKKVRVIFIYLGNNDIIEGNLPIAKNIMAGKFSVKIKILKSKVRGAVIVQYQNCKI